MSTRRLPRRIVRTPTVVFFTIPITFSAGFRERMPSIALRTIPAVLAVRMRLGRVMCQMIRTVPTMSTACGFGIHTMAIGTIPAVTLWAVGIDSVMGCTGCTPPVMIAIFFLFQNFLAIVAIPPTARTNCIRCMPRDTGGAVPKMRAGFSDLIRCPTGFIRAIPTIRIRRGTDNIFRVVFVFRRTVPEMRAVFAQHEDLSARFAHAIACDIGIRSGVLLLISRAIPGMIAVDIQELNGGTFFAIPAVVAVRI